MMKLHQAERGGERVAEGCVVCPPQGPSGAGKTCFLDILAQRKRVGRIGGDMGFNGEALTQPLVQRVSEYITQVRAWAYLVANLVMTTSERVFSLRVWP
jgi:adenylate kinase family enzyme